MRFYPPQTIVSPLTLIRRDRQLPGPGEILARSGERVEPVQVIGQARLGSEFYAVNVVQELGVSPRSAQRYIKVKNGQEVKRGQVVATRGKLGGRGCRSPVDGRVVAIGNGRLLIESASQEVEVRAGYYGSVVRVVPNQGVTIQVSGALIQGAWGNGQEGFGVLRMLTENREAPIKPQAIDSTAQGFILVGGAYIGQEALERAVELQVRGVIVGGAPPELLEEAKKLPFPLVAMEGVGKIPMSKSVFQLLATHNGREVVLDGRLGDPTSSSRPEIIIPLPAEAGTDRLKLEDVPLQVGDRVRAVRAPNLGVTGVILALPTTAVRAATGAHFMSAKVQPEEGPEPLLIPLANLEVLR